MCGRAGCGGPDVHRRVAAATGSAGPMFIVVVAATGLASTPRASSCIALKVSGTPYLSATLGFRRVSGTTDSRVGTGWFATGQVPYRLFACGVVVAIVAGVLLAHLLGGHATPRRPSGRGPLPIPSRTCARIPPHARALGPPCQSLPRVRARASVTTGRAPRTSQPASATIAHHPSAGPHSASAPSTPRAAAGTAHAASVHKLRLRAAGSRSLAQLPGAGVGPACRGRRPGRSREADTRRGSRLRRRSAARAEPGRGSRTRHEPAGPDGRCRVASPSAGTARSRFRQAFRKSSSA